MAFMLLHATLRLYINQLGMTFLRLFRPKMLPKRAFNGILITIACNCGPAKPAYDATGRKIVLSIGGFRRADVGTHRTTRTCHPPAATGGPTE